MGRSGRHDDDDDDDDEDEDEDEDDATLPGARLRCIVVVAVTRQGKKCEGLVRSHRITCICQTLELNLELMPYYIYI